MDGMEMTNGKAGVSAGGGRCEMYGGGQDGRGFGMTGIAGLVWLTVAAVAGLVSGLVVIALEEVRRRRNGR